MPQDQESEVEKQEAEERGKDLEPDDSPEKGLEGNLSDEDPEGREEREPGPETTEVTEEGED